MLIPLVGLASNDPVPGTYIAVNFAQGMSPSGTGSYNAILIGNKTTAGSATVDTVVYGPDTATQLATETDAINLFGTGSELHLMWKRFVQINKSTTVYAIAVTESVGAQATGTITIANWTSTANSTIRVVIGTTVVEVGVAVGDAYTTVATALAAAINAVVNLNCTAAVGSGANQGVITLTAKQKGLRGNWIRYSATNSSSAFAISPATRTLFTGGTSSDSSATALATIANTRYYYQVSAAEDVTQVLALAVQTDNNASPIVGIRSRVFAASVDTAAAAIAIAVQINAARCEYILSKDSDLTPAELASAATACYSLFETALGARSSLNFDGFGNDAVTSQYWKIPAPLKGTALSRNEIKSCLNNGVTPIGVQPGNKTSIVKRVTTRSLNGAVSDYRIRNAHKVTICDRFADDLIVMASSSFSGKTIANDPLPGQRIPGATVVTPTAYKIIINQLINEYATSELLQNAEEIKLGTQVVRESSPSTRLSARIPLQPIDVLDQVATNLDQIA